MDAPATDAGLDALLEHVKDERGFDFTGYKRPTVTRRVAKRMEAVGVASYPEYVDYLTVHPDEYAQLFDTLLINVTSFFRDPSAWEYLADDVVPRLLERRQGGEPIRIWIAGCATGEEALTVAMIFAEAMGAEPFCERVKVYGTDVDEQALAVARHATYPVKALEPVAQHLRERYFERVDQRLAFRKGLRRPLIFGRNDLVQDAPISRVDLLVCRNTLMYFNAQTQARILRQFHFALKPDGFLFLGRSEMLVSHSDLFVPVSARRRVFTKVVRDRPRDRLGALDGGAPTGARATDGGRSIREAAFETGPVAQLVLARDGTVVSANHRARTLLNIAVGDLGRPIQDLEASYRPVELRSHLQALYGEHRRQVVPSAAVQDAGGARRILEVHIDPVYSAGEMLGASITYVDQTREHDAEEQLEASRRELASAYEELQSTVEELETTNEELQSTNEELETTNEELQSSNEELETMNEELQSTNEELETINDELRDRTVALDGANRLMEAILAGLGIAVAVLDEHQRVLIWNRHAEQLWGLRSDEAEGQHVQALDVGFPLDRLRQPLKVALSDGTHPDALLLPATDRRGRAFDCRVTVLPLDHGRSAPGGAILLMERAVSG